MSISRYRFQIMCRLSRPIQPRVTATMRGTKRTGPPKCRSVEWKHGLGLFPGAQSATSGYDERLNSVEWPIRLSSNTLKHNWGGFSWRGLTLSGYDHRAKYNRLACFNQWFNSVKCSSVCIFLFSVLQEKQIKNVVCELMTVDNELKNLMLWYQMLGMEAVSAEMLTTILSRRTICARVQAYTHIERERERERDTHTHTQIVMYYVQNGNNRQQLQQQQQQQQPLKVKSHFI